MSEWGSISKLSEKFEREETKAPPPSPNADLSASSSSQKRIEKKGNRFGCLKMAFIICGVGFLVVGTLIAFAISSQWKEYTSDRSEFYRLKKETEAAYDRFREIYFADPPEVNSLEDGHKLAPFYITEYTKLLQDFPGADKKLREHVEKRIKFTTDMRILTQKMQKDFDSLSDSMENAQDLNDASDQLGLFGALSQSLAASMVAKHKRILEEKYKKPSSEMTERGNDLKQELEELNVHLDEEYNREFPSFQVYLLGG